MAPHRPPRPNELIDALDAKPRKKFKGKTWRVVREGRDPLRGARPGGRWDDGTFDVLYSALEPNGAIAEIQYHLMKGLPVVPSRVKYFVHEIEAELDFVIDLSDMSKLEDLGVDIAQFGKLSYIERVQEYPTTQQIAEVAHFLDFDGMLVPNARWSCTNLIVFSERIAPDRLSSTCSGKPIDWTKWSDSLVK